MLKQKDICDYNSRCLMSSGLMFDEIIVNTFRNMALEFHMELVDRNFTKTDNNKIYMYRGSLQDFYSKKGTNESLDVVCLHLNIEKLKMRQYLSNILKWDTQSDDIEGEIYH